MPRVPEGSLAGFLWGAFLRSGLPRGPFFSHQTAGIIDPPASTGTGPGQRHNTAKTDTAASAQLVREIRRPFGPRIVNIIKPPIALIGELGVCLGIETTDAAVAGSGRRHTRRPPDQLGRQHPIRSVKGELPGRVPPFQKPT